MVLMRVIWVQFRAGQDIITFDQPDEIWSSPRLDSTLFTDFAKNKCCKQEVEYIACGTEIKIMWS